MNKIWGVELEVDLNSIIFNINEIRKIIGKDVQIMPIIKDNAYGTYINNNIKFLEEAKFLIVGVSMIDEAIQLRKNGYKGDIFILNQIYAEDIPAVIKYNIIVGIGSIEFLSKLGEYKEQIKIHMEIGTGMGRTGINPIRTQEYIDEAKKYSNIEIDGIYTHFSCSDCDEKYTNTQIKSFERAIKIARASKVKIRYIHCCNSAGIINFGNAHFNLVRPGLIIYGYYPSEELKSKINLKPATKLKSKISFIKEVPKGTSISYGRTFITSRRSKIATIQIGYSDGIRRILSNKGKVIINKQVVPIVGNICMDSFMVDITDLKNVKVGDEVYLWDNENITVEDIAKVYGTINYEVLVSISDRIKRTHKKDLKIEKVL